MSMLNPTRLLLGVAAVLAVGGLRIPSVEEVVDWLSSYPAVVVLLLITVTGELLVLAAVIVATHGDWSLAEVVLWLFVGTVVSDAAWFWLAGVVDRRWTPRREASPRQQQLVEWLRRHTGSRPYLALLFIKFLYGSRFLMLVYLATRRVSLSKFLIYDAVGTALWLAVLVPAGWLLAHGLITAADVGRIDLVVLAIVVALLALRGGSSWITARARRRSLPS